jgi:hypothetical protein
VKDAVDIVGFGLAKDETIGDERWVEIRPPEGHPLLVLARRATERACPNARAEHPSSPVMFGCRDLAATCRELSGRGVPFAGTGSYWPTEVPGCVDGHRVG